MKYIITFDKKKKKVLTGYYHKGYLRHFFRPGHKEKIRISNFKGLFIPEVIFLEVYTKESLDIHSATTYVVENYPEVYL